MIGLSPRRLRPYKKRSLLFNVQAGLLTSGSSYLPRLPIIETLSMLMIAPQTVAIAVFVPGYSAGPVPDFHGVPS